MASKRLIPLLFEPLLSSIRSTPSSSRVLSRTTALSNKPPSCLQPLQHPRLFSSTTPSLKDDPSSTTTTKIYTYPEIASLSSRPNPKRILIDVREPSELQSTGTIPGSKNVPITTSPDAFFLSAPEFEDKFGFPRPSEQDEVVFFCKSGVRSKAAAQLARNAGFGGVVGEYPGSWSDWSEKGGEVEKVR